MNLNITGHHVDLTPALRDHVADKIKRLERHFDRLIGAEVVLTVERFGHKAEATIHASGAQLHAEAIESDMYAAIDGMMDKLDGQTRRHKERLRGHRPREGLKEALGANGTGTVDE
ncbi:MAG: ribosome-associated translation inhibitor RaiA [Gammaproteobacteria bacterium]|nr:ribosome-associated translation inhibitor RaiA [Gammaproteobacteria bacterium]